MQPKITERSLYPAIEKIFSEMGAKAVQEVRVDSYPDLLVKWLGEQWIVSVKIGDPNRPKILKNAFLQYITHMRDTGINYGMIIFFPDSIRKISPDPSSIERAVRKTRSYIIVLNPQLELYEFLPDALRSITEVIAKKTEVTYNLKTVIKILREHIDDMMKTIDITEREVVELLSDPQLFFGLGGQEKLISKKYRDDIAKFLATYIFLTQVLFLKLYTTAHPGFLSTDPISVTRKVARDLFNKIKSIDYRPIFEFDTLDLIPENYIVETFRLIWGLGIDKLRYELPGRLFHDLIPKTIRKLLVAFYTRPIAAYLLAQLTIDDPKEIVFDPACGSGTILTAAYRRKLELWKERGLPGDPHKLFCEEQIYGSDIMPFAVHLTNANLAAMNPSVKIEKTLIALADSLKLSPHLKVKPGFLTLQEAIGKSPDVEGFNRKGEKVKFIVEKVDVVLMNPPFTKVERGIGKYIDLNRFKSRVGKEVGLWGHFIALADLFLKDGGKFGGVIPINILRGRESRKVRSLVFKEWLPLYIVKATRNYGFSEWAEYRDILLIARKTKRRPEDHKVKFCLIKKDLNDLTENEVLWISKQIRTKDKLRHPLLDIDSYPLQEIHKNIDNLMPFISGPSLRGKEALLKVAREAQRVLSQFPPGYFREAFGARPKGVSKILFVTNPLHPGRIQESFLILKEVRGGRIIATTTVGAIQTGLGLKPYQLEFSLDHFLPSLRTPVGLKRMDVSDILDYVAKEPYEGMEKVARLAGYKGRLDYEFWRKTRLELNRSRTNIAVVRRINPYSPNQYLLSFYSEREFYPASTFHSVKEPDKTRAKAVAAILNSIFFLSYFFLLKEETTGRYIDVRQHDLYEMKLYPAKSTQARRLARVFEKYRSVEFKPLRYQLDQNYDEKYRTLWGENQEIDIDKILEDINPDPLRLEYDMMIVQALEADLTQEDILEAYRAIIEDMLITRRLRKD